MVAKAYSYLVPLETSIRGQTFSIWPILRSYRYPLGNPQHVEDHIQEYCNTISWPIQDLYRDICGPHHRFGIASYLRPRLNTDIFVEPDIIHFAEYESEDGRFPEICFGLGDYKTENYYLSQGFEEFKVAIEDFRRMDQQAEYLYQDTHWNPGMLFALVLRVFKYDIEEGQMSVDYYIINEPETVAHGITLRLAMAGFFYQTEDDAIETQNRLKGEINIAHTAKKLGPLLNVRPKSLRDSSRRSFDTMTEEADKENVHEIQEKMYGNTYCRVISDSAKCYPSLSVQLPSTVFVKLYYYSSRLWRQNDLTCFSIPDRKSYYDMFFNEVVINEEIAKSQFASNFPKLFASGYWNGLTDHPMHIFEYLGAEIPREKWDEEKIYKLIRLRLKELHLLRISHNDIRRSNIHVSESGKITLIDFGLSKFPCSEASKQDDLESLDSIFGVNRSTSKKEDAESAQSAEIQVAVNDKTDTDHNDEGDANTSSEVKLAEMSFESHDTKTTTTTK